MEPLEAKKLIGLRIKSLRRSEGLSQEELAERMGISSKYLSSIERGKENPTLDTLIRLANALKIEPSEIFNFSHEGKSKRDLIKFITTLLKTNDEEKLKLATRLIKTVYL
jgi:transcriptional regulator with XRE-family HTH domain